MIIVSRPRQWSHLSLAQHFSAGKGRKKIYATVVASLRISKLKKRRGAAAAAHCSYYPVPALKYWAKERNEHCRGLRTISINQ
jgi:hypothetical protein